MPDDTKSSPTQNPRPDAGPDADARRPGSEPIDTDRHLPAGGSERPREYGGRKGPDPVRYGDWEKNGRCIDF
jgi:hypothetical protein